MPTNNDLADKVLGKRIEKSEAFKELLPLLPKDQQNIIKQSGVIAWLSQTGQEDEQ